MTNRILPRRFHLQRNSDIHGVSGEGIVAEGVQFFNGTAVLSWLTPLSSTCLYHSVDVLIKIHGHEGATILIWDDVRDEKAEHDENPPEKFIED